MVLRTAALSLLVAYALGSSRTWNSEWAKAPVKSGEFIHLQDGLARVYIHDGYVGASGVWVDPAGKNPPAGPSVSHITCLRSDGTCEEAQAIIVGVGDGTFSVIADHAEYQIDRWNEEEIVAKGQPSVICKVLNVVRIDLRLKKVYAFQTLTEPVDEHLPKLSKDLCGMVGSNWELHEETPFSTSPTAKTLLVKQN